MANMADLVEGLADTYREMWGVEAYQKFSPGFELVDLFEDMADPPVGSTILDAGCGAGKGALELERRGYQVAMCDLIADAVVPEARHIPFRQVVLWQSLGGLYQSLVRNRKPLALRFDYVYCCDVLEHVPPTFVMLSVQRLLTVARRGMFLAVSLKLDQLGIWVGTHLHQTVQPFTAWRDQLRELGQVEEARDLLNRAVFWVRP